MKLRVFLVGAFAVSAALSGVLTLAVVSDDPDSPIRSEPAPSYGEPAPVPEPFVGPTRPLKDSGQGAPVS